DRVERAVTGELGVERERLVRVTGDLLGGDALVVQHVGVERDRVADVVGGAGEHRAALDDGAQHHLQVGVGVVGRGVRAVVGQVGRVAAVGQGAPGVGAARATRAVPRTV